MQATEYLSASGSVSAAPGPDRERRLSPSHASSSDELADLQKQQTDAIMKEVISGQITRQDHATAASNVPQGGNSVMEPAAQVFMAASSPSPSASAEEQQQSAADRAVDEMLRSAASRRGNGGDAVVDVVLPFNSA